MTSQTRQISPENYIKEVVPETPWSPIYAERMMWDRMQKGDDYLNHHFDITYIVRCADIREYFTGRGAPDLTGDMPTLIERHGELIAQGEATRNKEVKEAKAKDKKPKVGEKKPAVKVEEKPKDAHMPQIRRQKPEPAKEVVEPA